MSKRIDPSWVVFASVETPEGERCVDLFERPDGSCGFEAFRRDVEDRGVWTPVAHFSALRYPTRAAAVAAAARAVPWLPAVLDRS